MPQIWHMCKLLDVHLWENYATNEIATINDVAKNSTQMTIIKVPTVLWGKDMPSLHHV